MSLTKDIYEAFKTVMAMEARLNQLSESVATVSGRLEVHAERLTASLENHAERLARLEGKFELLKTSVATRRRKLPE
jgi:phage shock protein A